MKSKLTIEEIKKIQLDILIDVHKFCMENDITYFISYGTLLGAVRHKGYIPWDDDIDIVMPRPDYEKFKLLYNAKQEKYCFITNDLNENFMYTYAKVSDMNTQLIENVKFKSDIGVNIDIFPLDGIDDDLKILKRQQKLGVLQGYLQISNTYLRKKLTFVGMLFYNIIFNKFVENRTIKSMMKNALKHNYEKSSKITQLSTGGLCNIPLDKNIFLEKCLLDFEGFKFYAPKKYDEYLKSIYGDYMKLPPKEKQITHHSYTVFYRK